MKEAKGETLPVLLCPSAQPEMPGAVIFGVVVGTAAEPRVAYLEEPKPASDDLLALASPVKPTEVFRLAARCATTDCQHFDGSCCRLATRTVQLLDPVVQVLPLCRIRPSCRWWLQEGKEACLRCPQIVTENYQPSEPQREAARPTP
jgi:hypothetical protein